MIRTAKDSKALLFENMVKLNPGFKLNNVISAKNLNEGLEMDTEVYTDKAEKIKGVIDDLLSDQEYGVIDSIYRLLISRSVKNVQQNVNEDQGNYQIKVDELKRKLDYLSMQNDKNYKELLGKIETIITKLMPSNPEAGIAEGSDMPQQNDTYFNTLSEALDSVRIKVGKKGYTVDEDAMFFRFGTGGINYGETKRDTIQLLKDGVPQKNRSVTISIYRMDSGKYELTSYIN